MRGIVAIASTALLLIGCASDKATPSQPASSQPIVIGATAALTGALADFGPGVRNGVKVAEQYINASGGVLGRPVNFVILDDGTDDAKTNQAIDDLMRQKMSVFIGPTGSNQAIGVNAKLFDAGIPEISASASTPSINQPARERFFFRTAASHARQAKALAVMALRGTVQARLGTESIPLTHGACKRVVLVHTSDEYGKTMADPLKKYIADGGGTVVRDVDLGGQAAQASYQAKVAEVVSVGGQADCQILLSFPGVGAQYMKDFRRAVASDSKRDWTTFDTIASNGLYNNYKPVFIQSSKLDDASLAAEGVVGAFPETNPSTREFDEFKALYAAQFGADAEVLVYAANAFDAAILAALAIEAAHTSTDGRKIRDALFDVASGGDSYTPAQLADAIAAVRAGSDVDYKGASGDVSFDDLGDVLSDYVAWKVEGGKFVTKGRVGADETKP